MNKYLILITIISWGFWAFLNKIIVGKTHPYYLLLIGCIVSACLIPVYLLIIKSSNVQPFPSFPNIALIVFASLISTLGGLAYIIGIRTGQIGTIAVLSCSYPLITVILAAVFLGETITLAKIIGILLVISGVIILGT